MKNIPALTKEYVYKECQKEANQFGMNAFTHHFTSVVHYARKLAHKRNADIEIVEIAAWLHDIASIKGEYEEHHIAGQKYAEEFLRNHNYPQSKIDSVKHCILAHRGSKSIPRETVEAECISDADAMSHFNTIPSLFYLAINIREMDADEAGSFVKGKLQRSYKKLTPIGKEYIQLKYNAIMKFL